MSQQESQLRTAAQYLRMSRESQRYSLGNQAEVIRQYAEQHGYRIVRTFVDSGRSGLTAKGREGLGDLLKEVVSGTPDFAALLVLDVTRWGRYQDPDEAAHYEFLCRSAGVDVCYCAEAFEPGLAGSVLKHIKRVMAGEYSRELSEKVRVAKARRALAGCMPGGRVRYGFRRQVVEQDGTLGRILERGERKQRPEQTLRIIHEGPEQSRVIRQIFRLFRSEHLQSSYIAERLNRSGARWSDGSMWTNQRVSQVLHCDLVTGRQPFGKTTVRLGKKICNKYDTWGFVQVCEPIVSIRTFKAAQKRLKTLAGGRTRTDEELLEDLRKLKARYGKVSLSLLEQDPDFQCAHTYFTRFGALTKAYELAGLAYERRERGRRPDGARISREEMISVLRQLYQEEGKICLPLCHTDKRLPPLHWLRREFGSLGEAFDAAGVPHRVNSAIQERRRLKEAGFVPQRVPGTSAFIGPRGVALCCHKHRLQGLWAKEPRSRATLLRP